MKTVSLKFPRFLMLSAMVLTIPLAAALADDKPGPNHISAEAAIKAVTDAGYTSPHDVDFDLENDKPNGEWEIEAYKDGKKYDIEVDATTGKIVRERLDD